MSLVRKFNRIEKELEYYTKLGVLKDYTINEWTFLDDYFVATMVINMISAKLNEYKKEYKFYQRRLSSNEFAGDLMLPPALRTTKDDIDDLVKEYKEIHRYIVDLKKLYGYVS